MNVFKEAKDAYRERKADISANRRYLVEEKKLHQLRVQGPEDDRSSTPSRRPKHSSRRQSSSHKRSDGPRRVPTSPVYPESHVRLEEGFYETRSRPNELPRRHTYYNERFSPPSPRRTMSSPSKVEDLDMNLAYGDIPPPLPVARVDEEMEFNGLVGKVRILLEEADCVHYSVTAMIASLQKNPDAMAAVALTLAEISKLATKMAPALLASMKGSAPAVFALLASPQFLIAAGVGVGVTIVALGGYKIIMKIRAANAEDPAVDEMIELGVDVNRINNWRRGISEIEEQSVGTSADGEFITPMAANMSRLNLQEEKAADTFRRKHRSSRALNESGSSSGSKKSSRSSKSSKSSKPPKPIKEKKTKKPSPLRLMFS